MRNPMKCAEYLLLFGKTSFNSVKGNGLKFLQFCKTVSLKSCSIGLFVPTASTATRFSAPTRHFFQPFSVKTADTLLVLSCVKQTVFSWLGCLECSVCLQENPRQPNSNCAIQKTSTKATFQRSLMIKPTNRRTFSNRTRETQITLDRELRCKSITTMR